MATKSKAVVIALPYTPEALATLKNGDRVLFWDLETTGLNHVKNGIVQITCILCEYRDGKFTIHKIFNSYVNPEIPMDPGAAEVTGITDEFLADKPKESEIFEEVYNLFNEADYTCGHNIVSFDMKFLSDFYCHNGHAGETFGFEDKAIDTLMLSRELVPKEIAVKNSHKLCNMMEFYGLEVEGEFHDALTDVKSCILLLEKLLVDYYDALEKEANSVAKSGKGCEIVIKSVTPWMAKFPGAYIKANYLFINTNIGSFRFNRYNYKWEEREVFRPYNIQDVITATFKYCRCENEGDLARWKSA